MPSKNATPASFLLLVLGTTLAVASLLPAAAAPAAPPDWEAEARQVSARSDGAGLLVSSSRDSLTGTDTLQASYDSRSATLAYSLQATRPSASTLALSMAFRAVTEFRDADGDGRLGAGDEVVRRWAIPGTPALSAVQPAGPGSWSATATHHLGEPSGVAGDARFRVTVTASSSGLGGARPEPSTFTLATELLDVARGNGTHLALEVAFGSTRAPTALAGDLARVEADGYRLAVRWLDPDAGAVLEGGAQTSALFVRSAPAEPQVVHSAALAASRPTASGGEPDAFDPPHGSVAAYAVAAVAVLAALAVPAWRLRGPHR